MSGQGPACFGHLHEGKHSLVHTGSARGADDDHRTLGLGGCLDDPGDLLTHNRSHGGRQERKIHHRQSDGMSTHVPRPRDHGVDESCLFTIGLETILVGGDTFEAERIDRRHRGIRLLKGSFVNQCRDPLVGSHGEMMAALGADAQIFLNGEMMNHLGTSGALGPKTFGHLAPIFSRKLEGRLFENGHGLQFCNKSAVDGKPDGGSIPRHHNRTDL